MGVTPTTATDQRAPLRRRRGGARAVPRRRARASWPPTVRAFLRALGDDEAPRDAHGRDLPPARALRRVRDRRHARPQLDPPRARAGRARLPAATPTPSSGCSRSARRPRRPRSEALALAHDAGKRVLGVLNKVDRAETRGGRGRGRPRRGDRSASWSRPWCRSRRSERWRRAGREAVDPAYAAVAEALERRFFDQARALKRATALAALKRFLARRARGRDGAGAQRLWRAADRARRGAPPAWRSALSTASGSRCGRGSTRRTVARPSRSASSSSRARGCSASTARRPPTRRSWRSCSRTPSPARPNGPAPCCGTPCGTKTATDGRDEAGRNAADIGAEGDAIDAAIDRFVAYARGVIESGAVPDFFRNQLPRLRLDVGAIRDALARRAPDPGGGAVRPPAPGAERRRRAPRRRDRHGSHRRRDARARPRRAHRRPAGRAG